MTAPGEPEPQSWVQWSDGSWAPVYADGWTGEPVRLTDMLGAARSSGELAGPYIDVDPLSVTDIEPTEPGGEEGHGLR
ncbi:hypothetical protein [Nocardia cyriacigeorgica]|jgi:hypothetical protein|uniref:hypothetical protein n=1 Tax=Nocardia cyriacigeorgica TaxID=135487 RepID=UPI00055BCC45|nr:hypothetical protein [Nocardia cyriacigeorgica]AVH24109.1 hypothetical protein C5B73_24500 [Nocardia cyriacigeorgica]MBF6326366.1 hypothetical protein [Nocardia cyriacigeorgica]PPJ05561.1 hypothetical protein C5E43_21330 [Nocardia cyriacigeorgica]TLF59869.1 hypothetical protein FEK31_05845 [Nocardia cyriacigeorgica]